MSTMSNTNSLENRKKFIPAKIVKDEYKSNLHVKILDKPVRVYVLRFFIYNKDVLIQFYVFSFSRTYPSDQVYVTKDERQQTSTGYAPKR